MRLIAAEMKKIGQNRPFLVLVCICMLVNIWYICFGDMIASKVETAYEGCFRGVWKKDLEITKDMEWEEKKQWFRDESNLAAYLIAQERGFPHVIEMMEEEFADWSDEEWETRIKELREYADGIPLYSIMYRHLRWYVQMDYLESYPAFLERAQKKADSMQAMALFSEPDSFNQQAVANTAKAYKRLDNLTLGMGYSPVHDIATDSRLTDVMSIILIWVLAWIVFFQEKANGFYPMLRGTKNGQVPLISVKIIAFFLAVGMLGVVLYASQIAALYLLYGSGGEHLALQSIETFRNSVWLCSIGAYTCRFLVMKIIAMVIIGCVMMVVFARGNRFVLTSCLIAGICGIEWFWYHGIESASRWNILKYVNLFYLQDVEEQARNYINVNVASHAVWSNHIVWIAGSIAGVLSIAVTIWLFSRRSGKTADTKALPLQTYMAVWKKPGFWYRTTSVGGQEAGKLYRNCQACLAILLLCIFSWNYADGIPQYQPETAQIAYQNYTQKYQGYYTEETKKQLEEEQKFFSLEDEEALEIEQKWNEQTISEKEYEEWQDQRERLINARQAGFERFWKQAQVVEAAFEKTEKAGFVDTIQFSYLMEDDGRQIVLAMILLSFVSIFSCTLFGMEYTTGMDRLLHTTWKGRGILLRAKILQLIGIGTLLFLILYVPYEWSILKQLERVPFEVALMSVPHYETLTIPLEIGQAFCLTLIMRYLTMLFVILASAVITRIIRHTIFSIAACLLLFVVPCFLLFIGVDMTSFTCAGGMLLEMVLRSR